MYRRVVNREKSEVKFNQNKNPYIETKSYSTNGKIIRKSIMTVKNFLERKELLKKPMIKVSKYSLSPQNFEINNRSPQPSYNPVSPDYSKLNTESSIRLSNKCMPQTFLYRSFKPSPGKKYFNYVSSNGIKNIVPNNKTTQGIVYVTSGTEGASFVGCVKEDCKEKVLIKASVANKPYNNSAPAREFKMNRDIFLKCKDSSPHIVMPYLMQICPQNKAFLPLKNQRLPKNMNIKKDSQLAIGYYEFYNGGDLMGWMKRH